MSLKKGPLWVVAFDGGKASIFLKSGARAEPELDLLDSFELTNPPDHEQSRDSQGRLADGAGRTGGSGMSAGLAVGASRIERTDAHDQAEAGFVADLIDHLNAKAEADAFAELVLLGAPQALGVARPKMSPALKQRLVAEADKDVAGEPADAIARHVGHLLMPD